MYSFMTNVFPFHSQFPHFQTKLVICPEGTRHGGETLLPFKKGTFHLAIETQCPIQPVVVSRYDFLDHDKKIFNRGKILAYHS